MLQRPKKWDPNYLGHFLWRADASAEIMSSKKCRRDAFETYFDNPWDWINDWLDTFDPRNASKGQLVRMPFLLFKRQRQLIRFFHSCVKAEASGAIGTNTSRPKYSVPMMIAATTAVATPLMRPPPSRNSAPNGSPLYYSRCACVIWRNDRLCHSSHPIDFGRGGGQDCR
jgi:hypothetical protein